MLCLPVLPSFLLLEERGGLRPRPPGPRGRSSGLGNPGRAECRTSPEPALRRGGQRSRRPGVGSGGRGVLTRALWASVAFFQDARRSDLSRALCWSVYADVSDAKPGTRSAGPRSRQTDLHGAPMFDPHLAPDPARAVPLSAPGSPSAGRHEESPGTVKPPCAPPSWLGSARRRPGQGCWRGRWTRPSGQQHVGRVRTECPRGVPPAVLFRGFQAVSPKSRLCGGPPCGGWALRPEPGAPFKVPAVPRSALGDLLTAEGGVQGGEGPSPHAWGASVEKQALQKPFPELQQRLARGPDTPKGATLGLTRGGSWAYGRWQLSGSI